MNGSFFAGVAVGVVGTYLWHKHAKSMGPGKSGG